MEQIRWSRRAFLGAGGAAAALATARCVGPGSPSTDGSSTEPFDPAALAPPPGVDPAGLAGDEAYWARVAAHYDVTDEVIQLENGNWGMMPRPVLEAYVRHTGDVNRRNSYYARREYGADAAEVRRRVAAALDVGEDEIAFTRGATEALQALIGGYNRLRPGDAVLYADLDYTSMQYAMDWLQERRGVRVVRIDIPEPATTQNVLDAYRAALEADARIRLVLLTHVSHRTGLALPVAEVAALARAYGADAILDAAHSFGQMAFSVRDLGVPFIGFNLHKWIGAPIGVGVMYVARNRLGDVDTYMADRDAPADDVRSRVHTGTSNYAAYLSVPTALDVHDAIGVAFKEARLRRLRALWAEELRGRPGLEVLTPDDPGMHAGITSFRLTGRTSAEDNVALARSLLDDFGIFTVHRTGVAKGACVRVTPALFTAEADVIALRDALVAITAA
jgi:selenocysteine lyase/cysteine desulfurase